MDASTPGVWICLSVKGVKKWVHFLTRKNVFYFFRTKRFFPVLLLHSSSSSSWHKFQCVGPLFLSSHSFIVLTCGECRLDTPHTLANPLSRQRVGPHGGAVNIREFHTPFNFHTHEAWLTVILLYLHHVTGTILPHFWRKCQFAFMMNSVVLLSI